MRDQLFTLPPEIETRWATFENPTGEKGGACRGNDGRKRAPCTALKAGAAWTLADWDQMQYGFYRLHIPDPVYFRREIRATIQQIGCCDVNTCTQMRDAGRQLVHGDAKVDMDKAIADKGYALFERQDDWSSCAYLYLDRPENNLPALAPVAAWIAGLMPEPGTEKKGGNTQP